MSIDLLLAALVIVLVPFSWLSAFILFRAARSGPQVGALTERTIVACVVGIMVTSAGGLTLNRVTGYTLLPLDAARIVFSLSVIALASVPVAWVVLWYEGRLGG
jgi:hypothetical protein